MIMEGQVPILKVATEDPFLRGKQIGEAFLQRIQDLIKLDYVVHELRQWIQTEQGGETYAKILANHEKVFPKYVEELRGVAAGAEVAFNDIMLLNLEIDLELLLWSYERCSTSRNIPEKCSGVLLFTNDLALQAHNEDEYPIFRGLDYIVETNTWVAHCFGGQLPGASYAFNTQHGLSFTTHTVMSPVTDVNGLGQFFIFRDLLEATSLEDATQRLLRYPRLSGFGINIGSVKEQRLLNFEIVPGSEVKTTYGQQERGCSAHFNLFTRLDVMQEENPSSLQRMERFKELSPFSTKRQLLDFLGDTSHPTYHVYRTKEKSVTLSTAVFDLIANEVSVYVGNPSKTDPILTLPLMRS